MAGGYQTIGEKAPVEVVKSYGVDTEVGAGGYQSVAASVAAPSSAHSSASPTISSKVPSAYPVGGEKFSLSNLASGARETVTGLIQSPAPEVKIFTEPINPGAPMSFQERCHLVIQSVRPWNEFFGRMNMPAPSEIKLRYGHNIETYFYNCE